MYVIAGPIDPEDGTLYWSNEDGWGFLSTATVFTNTELNLPMEPTARWVELPELRPRIVALVDSQGTACAETALRGSEDTPENRSAIERIARADLRRDAAIPGTWTDVSDNEWLQCDNEWLQ